MICYCTICGEIKHKKETNKIKKPTIDMELYQIDFPGMLVCIHLNLQHIWG